MKINDSNIIDCNVTYSLPGLTLYISDVKPGDKVILKPFSIPETVIEGKNKLTFEELKFDSLEAVVINVTDKEVNLMFENSLFESPIDLNNQKEWKKTQLNEYLTEHFMPELNKQIPVSDVTLLTYEEVFGKNRLEYFRSRKNRICMDLEDNFEWWWLKTPYEASAAYFCDAGNRGDSACTDASCADCYVRPRFTIKK